MSFASFILDISFSVFLVDSCLKLTKLEDFEKASMFATTAPHLQPVARASYLRQVCGYEKMWAELH